ncbi:MAG: prepilin-type N-terminal cleavage/methylation domain-containing protein [Chthonomonas sp.]|nr:prepilin-type N-terminal cleavage/methylation domain-containing protein [Chthonomonas sp.]
MNRQRRLGFTLIELLVVIAIIAILAAILFPVFAQAKVAAKKTQDLSNVRQIATASIMYAGDQDDTLPQYKWPDFYAIATKLLPYTKNKDIFKNPTSPYKVGSVQQKQGRNPYGNYVTAPNDPCIGLPASTRGAANLYDDIYPPLDYAWNDSMRQDWSGALPGCSGGVDLGMSMTASKITDQAKAAMWIGFPSIGTMWPGGCVDGTCDYGATPTSLTARYWGTDFKGYFSQGSNVNHLDGHAQYYKYSRMHPGNKETFAKASAEGGTKRIDVKAWGFDWGHESVR